jgi:hypothetical protein
MPPKKYDLKGITLGFNGRATTLVANEIVNGGFCLDLGVRGFQSSYVQITLNLGSNR